MPTMKAGPGRALVGGGGNYNDLIMGTQPIAYWPQSESSGLVARCLVNPAQNGTYNGVTLADDNTGPFGTPAPFYGGLNDYCNILTAALIAAFSGTVGSLMIWSKVFNLGVWTDGATRTALSLFAGGVNFARVDKSAANDTAALTYRAAGVNIFRQINPITSVAWDCYAITWDDTIGTDQAIMYRNAVQQGAVGTPIGTWAGNLAAGTLIGAVTAVPVQPYHGWLGPCAIWGRALPPAEIAGLYVT